LRLKVKPEDVIILDEPILLPKNIFYSSNYRIVKPTTISKETYNTIKDFTSTSSYKIDIVEFPEGREFETTHKVKERNSKVANLAKQNYFNKTNSYKCEACGFDFFEVYGDIGKGYIEAHHIKPISNIKKQIKTTINDFAMLCSNCHKMIHRKRPWISYNELKNLLST
jgi:predicted HNH restriction endonuclease